MSIRTILSTAAIAAAMLAGGANAVSAQSAPASANEEFMQKLLGKTPVKSIAAACYTRVYDAAHLSAHPLQKVTQMHVVVRADTRVEESGTVYSFVAGLKKRGGKDLLTGSGGCGQVRSQEGEGPVSHIGCGVDCDGGGVSIEPGKSDKSLIVRINDFIAVSGPTVSGKDDDEPGERVGISAGQDDKVFRLERVAIEQCAKLFDSKEAYQDFVAPK